MNTQKMRKKVSEKNIYIFTMLSLLGEKNTTFYFCFTYFKKLFLLTQSNIFFFKFFKI